MIEANGESVKNFKLALVRNFTGMFFIAFLIMYLLFNVLTNNFISAEAQRELRHGISDFTTFTTVTSPHELELVVDSDSGIWHRMPMLNAYTHVNIPNIEGIQADGTAIFHTELRTAHFREIRPVRGLLMNVDSIMVSENNELLSPNLNMATVDAAVEVLFLANYYVSNRNAFENQQMVRVANAPNTYYMMAINVPLSDNASFSFLLHTDVSSAISFMNSLNIALGILLLSTGMVAALISFFMSAKVQKSMLRLCNYAEVIGHGNFTAEAGNFEYKEFNNLAQSMNSMSNMLQTYENNQKQFFQNVSHEMRTPLMSIQGYAEGILADVLDKEEATKIILTESERMTALVSRLLYVSRMDSGLNTLSITTVNLRFLLYDCAERIKILAEKDNKKITFDFPEDSPDPEIKSDENKLQTIIDNILQNCIRHAKTEITLKYHTTAEKITIIISDDGEGISQEDLPHIFKRFYMGENGNSGLGLSICKDIVKQLSGEIIAENGHGAKFIITLPRSYLSTTQ